MSDHILYKEDTLSTAAAELDKLAGIMSDVTRQLGQVDTSAEWWEHVRSSDGDSAVSEVRALRKASEGLDRRSAQLAGSVRQTVDNFGQVEADVTRLCQIDGPGNQLPYLQVTGISGGSVDGALGQDGFWDRIWGALADLIGDSSEMLNYTGDIMELLGMIGTNVLGSLGPPTSILTAFLSNLQEYISKDGAMSVDRAVCEFIVESYADLFIDSFITGAVAVVTPISRKAAIVCLAAGVIYNLLLGNVAAEGISDFLLGKEEDERGGRSSSGFRGGGRGSGGGSAR